MLTVRMPRFDLDGTPAVLLRRLRAAGERVSAGEALAVVECDKTTLELEAFATGILIEWLLEAGDMAPPFAAVARIAEPGDEVWTCA